ncbi:MAG TPA: aspartate kinase [Gammaproteobacteria bacterium]|nr:aspartate kinase [Gammaproteobacteria bacterium]
MALIVQKYGGSSLADVACIQHVAQKVQKWRNQGHSVVVVVSAMKGQTDHLDSLAKAISKKPSSREVDVLLATGEQITIALLSMALDSIGVPAKSYMGVQVPIVTDSAYTKARIVDIDDSKILADLAQGRVVVVAGFQGVDKAGNITTLGRGGSDTTAVALAAKLKADECQIYTDVEGVYTTDPRMVPNARLMQRITFEEMLELASLGAKVLQIRSVEFAGKYNVPLRVLSTFKEGPGTLIALEDKNMEHAVVSGIAFNRDEAKLIIRGVPDIPGVAGRILRPVSDANIEVDMVIQNLGDDFFTDFTFTVQRRDYQAALSIVNDVARDLKAKGVHGDDKIAKVSLVGVGMRSHVGIASKIFTVLGEEGINIQLIATSEIKVSVVIAEKYLELAVRALHEAFGLQNHPIAEKMQLAEVV